MLVCYFNRYWELFDKRLVLKIFGFIWIICILSCILLFFGWGYYSFNVWMVLCYIDNSSYFYKIIVNIFMLLDIIIVIFCNVKIVRVVICYCKRIIVNVVIKKLKDGES